MVGVAALLGALGVGEFAGGLIRGAVGSSLVRFTPAGDVAIAAMREVLDVFAYSGLVSDRYAATVDAETIGEALRRVISAAALLQAFGEELGELATESFSDGLSNALYAGILGAIDMTMRLRVGAVPPQTPFYTEYIDPAWRAWLDAASGTHFHALALGMLDQWLRGLRDALRADPYASALVDSYVASLFPELAIVSEYAGLLREAARRVYEAVAGILEALFARAEDAVLEWRAAKFMYDRGALDPSEYDQILARTHAELDAVEAELAALEEDLATALEGLSVEAPASVWEAWDRLRESLAGVLADEKASLSEYLATLANLRELGRPTGVEYRVRVADADEAIAAL